MKYIGPHPKDKPRKEYIYGIHPVLEILKCGKRTIYRVIVSISRNRKGIEEILQICKTRKIKLQRMPGQKITRILSFPNHQGVVVEVSPPTYIRQVDFISKQNLAPDGLYLFLDRVQDPRNFGGILRSAVAFNVDCVIIPWDKSAKLIPEAVKASAGLAERIPIVVVKNVQTLLEHFRSRNYKIIALEAHAGTPIYDANLQRPLICVLGGEDQGVRNVIKEKCDTVASIPIAAGVNSISVSAAAAVFLGEIARQNWSKNQPLTTD